MPDDNKLVIEVDADTQKFTVKMGSVEQVLKKSGDTGKSAFEGLGMKALFFNQALEAGSKVLELMHEGLETISRTEAFDNQRTALTNLAAQLGLSTQSVNHLIQAMIMASGQTITTAQAQDSAFKLLNAGFKAEIIPNLIEFAKRAEEVRKIPLEEGIQRLAFALETGSTRGLKSMGIELAKTGSQQQIMNAILAQAEEQIKRTGDGYENFGERIKAKSREMYNSIAHGIGAGLRDIGIGLFGTQTEKATQEVARLKSQLDQVNSALDHGVKSTQVFFRVDFGETIAPLDAKKRLTEEIARLQGVAAEGVQKEHEAIKAEMADVKQKGELLKPIDSQTATQVRIRDQKKMYEQLLSDDEEYAANSEGIAKGLEAARRAEIENTYQTQLRDLQGIPMTKTQYAQREFEIEKKKYAAIQDLRVSSEKAEQADNNAAYALALTRNMGYEGLAESRIKKEIDAENSRYQKDVQRLQLREMDENKLNKQIEQMAEQHQKALAQIQDRYQKPSIAGMRDGYLSAIAQMGKGYNNFATQTQKLTVGMHGVVSNSFIKMAKAHKFSMEEMLNNMLEFIGESMIQDGTFKLMAGLFPPNPAMIGVGAAEIALGSALVGSGGGGAPASSTGGSLGTDLMGQNQLTQPSTQQMQQKSAQIVINGDLLNSQETVNHIQELIRQNSDVTNYAIVAQGQQY